MKREIHITLDIDTKTHTGKQQMIVTEDGRRKKDWKVEEAITVTHALMHYATTLLEAINNTILR